MTDIMVAVRSLIGTSPALLSMRDLIGLANNKAAVVVGQMLRTEGNGWVTEAKEHGGVLVSSCDARRPSCPGKGPEATPHQLAHRASRRISSA